MIYLLYSPRSQGWLTKSSTYSSDISEAKTFSRNEALLMVKRQRDKAGYNLLPIRQEDIQ